MQVYNTYNKRQTAPQHTILYIHVPALFSLEMQAHGVQCYDQMSRQQISFAGCFIKWHG